MWGQKLITPPAVEPLTRLEAKRHARIEGDLHADNLQVDSLIAAARDHIETRTGRALINQTWDYQLERFPYAGREIPLPLPPLQSVTSVKYLDSTGVEQTLSASDYTVDAISEPGRILLKPDKDWPDTQDQRQATVTIRFVAGFGAAASDMPKWVNLSMKFLVAAWWDGREKDPGLDRTQEMLAANDMRRRA